MKLEDPEKEDEDTLKSVTVDTTSFPKDGGAKFSLMFLRAYSYPPIGCQAPLYELLQKEART